MSFSFSFAESLECKRSLKWICDFIIAQCSRPPPAHSKDLHSSIVAAFHCCKTWLLHHPYLLQDKECISTVLEVIEFGNSGNNCNTYVSHIVTSQLSEISNWVFKNCGYCHVNGILFLIIHKRFQGGVVYELLFGT